VTQLNLIQVLYASECFVKHEKLNKSGCTVRDRYLSVTDLGCRYSIQWHSQSESQKLIFRNWVMIP